MNCGPKTRYGQFAGASSAWFSDDNLLRSAEQLLTQSFANAQCHISGNLDGRAASKNTLG